MNENMPPPAGGAVVVFAGATGVAGAGAAVFSGVFDTKVAGLMIFVGGLMNETLGVNFSGAFAVTAGVAIAGAAGLAAGAGELLVATSIGLAATLVDAAGAGFESKNEKKPPPAGADSSFLVGVGVAAGFTGSTFFGGSGAFAAGFFSTTGAGGADIAALTIGFCSTAGADLTTALTTGGCSTPGAGLAGETTAFSSIFTATTFFSTGASAGAGAGKAFGAILFTVDVVGEIASFNNRGISVSERVSKNDLPAPIASRRPNDPPNPLVFPISLSRMYPLVTR